MKHLLPVFAGLAISINAVAIADDQPKAGAAPAAQPAGAVKPRETQPVPDITKTPTLFVVGYAHLDTQWRWSYQDSIREYLPKTLHDNFALFEKYPSYVFNFSGSRRYQMMKEYYPADYEKMKQYIAAGRWFPCGSSVDENDANVPSAESYVRHILYGNKYFRKEFGIASEEYMLPDCFGFPASLPTLLNHCGVKGFSTQKLTWNAVVPIPFKVGTWEGPDGSSVMAALDPGSYSAEVRENLANSNAWASRIKNNAAKSGLLVDYHYYGTGDTGGSPTERSVKAVEEAVHTNGQIKIISSAADEIFKAITPAQQKNLPRYKGELMLTEHSSGAVTSQAYMKRWNRKNEQLADAAEKASVGAWMLGGRDYPAQKLEDAWYLVLGSQMHDILPGTSLPKAYDLSWNDEVLASNQFSQVLTDASSSLISALDTQGEGTTLVVYNPLSCEREDVVEAEVPAAGAAKGVKVTGPDGKAVAAQVLSAGNGVARIAFVAKTPSVSYSSYSVELTADAQSAPSALKVSDHQLENEHYVVKLDANGDVSSVFDKAANKELLSSPIRMALHHENPKNWPAWNQDWADRQLPPKAYAGSPTSFKVVENGPARVAVEVTRTAEGSTFVQRIRLAGGAGGQRVEFDNDIDWRSKQRSLRVHFPLSIANPTATYDLAAGAIERGNGREKQYEYSFHQWFDLTEAADYGVTAMCDSKYGTDKPDDRTIRLTLLHTPGTRGGYPDQGTQDLGHHHVTFALYGHQGPWQQASGPAQAARLNQPLIAFQTPKHAGSLGKSHSLMRVSDPRVSISAAKKAEEGDEVIVRLREHAGMGVKDVRVATALPIVSAREVDGQERQIGEAKVVNGELVTDVKGYSLRAFAVKFAAPSSALVKPHGTPIALAFDADAVTTRASLADGSMDGKGNSLPAEMFPKTITSEGVTFNLGSSADGQKNAVACNGQTINIPEGCDRLCILAAADADTTSTITVDGKSLPWSVQAWNGYIGQWDRRIWSKEITESSENGDMVGLEPGFVKQDPVAWFASHYHTKAGDTFYEFCYLYKHTIDLPAGAKSVTLPKTPGIKVFAATAVKSGGAPVRPAAPLFDTLGDHHQDAPSIVPGGGTFSDAAEVRIQPNMYSRANAVYYTTDGSDPTAQSPVYSGPFTISKTTVVKASILGRDGRMSPVTRAEMKVNDLTAPTIKHVEAVYQSNTVRLEFSEPLGATAASATGYSIDPAIEVTKADLQHDGRTVVLTLAKAPEMNKPYKLTVTGVTDASPAANPIKAGVTEFTAAGPVYTLDTMTAEQRGKVITNVPNLPVKAKDAWTMNMYVKIAKQLPNRTVIAGFGKCEDSVTGGARYMAKFGGGAHFWSRNQDVASRTQLELNKWQMLTATYDGTTLRLYKDGKKIGEGTPTFADDEATICIAPKEPWEQMRQFDGELRGFTVWKAALGDSAIAEMAKSTPK